MSVQPSDPTFRTYSSIEALTYATHRLSYPKALYNLILSYHGSPPAVNTPKTESSVPFNVNEAKEITAIKATTDHSSDEGGGTSGSKMRKYSLMNAGTGIYNIVLDVGCGPGNATRDIATFFDTAIGIDPGIAMIEAARTIGGKTKNESKIRYEVCSAEDFSSIEGLEEGSVDMITSAMAAHWFDMPRFWTAAARVLNPGGTVALWTHASSYPHPSTPNYQKVYDFMLKFECETLSSYALPGNLLSRNMYDSLCLPWTQPSTSSSAFPKSLYQKHDFDRNGALTNPPDFFGGCERETLAEIEAGLGTASMVTRWRRANPELVGTDEDVLKVFMKELKELLGGQEWLVRGCGTAVLLFRRA